MIYIIEHSDKKFTGFLGGVDYHNGKGSTSDPVAARTAQAGCHPGPGRQTVFSSDL
jgi:hypothetical protein